MGLKLTILGFSIFILGILLLSFYLPLVGESALELSDDYEFGDFEHYSDGDHVIVYGTLTEMRVNSDNTWLILDGQDGIPIRVDGNISGYVEEGQDIYVGCTVYDSWACSLEYLTAQTDDIHPKSTLDIFFGVIAISGLVMATVSIVKKV